MEQNFRGEQELKVVTASHWLQVVVSALLPGREQLSFFVVKADEVPMWKVSCLVKVKSNLAGFVESNMRAPPSVSHFHTPNTWRYEVKYTFCIFYLVSF